VQLDDVRAVQRAHDADLAVEVVHQRAAARRELGLLQPRSQQGLERVLVAGGVFAQPDLGLRVGLYPIVTFQYSSTTLYQVSYHIRYLFF
jgi:hypothetical protein